MHRHTTAPLPLHGLKAAHALLADHHTLHTRAVSARWTHLRMHIEQAGDVGAAIERHLWTAT